MIRTERFSRSHRPIKKTYWDEYGCLVPEQQPKLITLSEPPKDLESEEEKRERERREKDHRALTVRLANNKLRRIKEREEQKLALLKAKSMKASNSLSKSDFESFIQRQNDSAKRHVEKETPVLVKSTYMLPRSQQILKKRRARSSSVISRSLLSSHEKYQNNFNDYPVNYGSLNSTSSTIKREFRLVQEVKDLQKNAKERLERRRSEEVGSSFYSSRSSRSASMKNLKRLSQPRVVHKQRIYPLDDNLLECRRVYKRAKMPDYIRVINEIMNERTRRRSIIDEIRSHKPRN